MTNKMVNVVGSFETSPSPQIGMTQMFTPEPKFSTRPRCVSKEFEVCDIEARSEMIQQRTQLTEANMSPLDPKRNRGSDPSFSFKKHLSDKDFRHGHFESTQPGENLGSVDNGQTVEIRAMTADSTRSSLTLVDILRENWHHTYSSQGKLSGNDSHHNPNSKGFSGGNIMMAKVLPKSYIHNRQNNIETEGTSRPYPSRRNRSRAIAIKHSSSEEHIEEIRQSTAAAEYDWATWRMYNRIIDHRLKYPSNYQHDETSAGGTSSSSLNHAMTASLTQRQTANENLEFTHASCQIHDYPEYGEVFDLDL